MQPNKGLTPELIAKLMQPKTRTPVINTSTAAKNTGGAFVSKCGTIRRSRKGRTSRNANGYAFYAPTIEEWQSVGLLLNK